MALTPDTFAGRVLFATGAGSGIAAEVARQFTAAGGRVAVLDVTAERAAGVAAELPGAVAFGADVADEDAVQAAVNDAAEAFGRLDGVLNAAGYADFGPLEEYSYARWQRMLAVHAGGTFLVCNHAVPQLRRTGGGSIVNVASTAAIEAQPQNFAYGAAKGAVVAFTRQIALDLAPDIRANAVAPGRTRSGITTPLYEQRGGGDYAEGARISAARIMQRRVAEPAEIAALICFLLSDAASFMTAGLYVADGGETSH